jgi:copper homeostasis protein (lipoprotein)
MKNSTKILIFALLFFLGAALAIVLTQAFPQHQTLRACTMEAKLCDDGTAVGRSGPQCEFAACPAVKPELILGHFTGMLPCADCSGIATDLTLIQATNGSTEGSYIMKETYTGRDVPPYITRGKWVTIQGDKKSKTATVYQLNANTSEQPQYFLKVDDHTIKMLDSQKAEIKSGWNSTLTKTPLTD